MLLLIRLSSLSKIWFVYVVETECGLFYTGITTDVDRRFQEHQAVREGGKTGAKFFRGRTAKKIVYRENCDNRSDASKREYAIKAMTRKQKVVLIKSGH